MEKVTLSVPEPLRQWIAGKCTNDCLYRENSDNPELPDDFVLYVGDDDNLIEYTFKRQEVA